MKPLFLRHFSVAIPRATMNCSHLLWMLFYTCQFTAYGPTKHKTKLQQAIKLMAFVVGRSLYLASSVQPHSRRPCTFSIVFLCALTDKLVCTKFHLLAIYEGRFVFFSLNFSLSHSQRSSFHNLEFFFNFMQSFYFPKNLHNLLLKASLDVYIRNSKALSVMGMHKCTSYQCWKRNYIHRNPFCFLRNPNLSPNYSPSFRLTIKFNLDKFLQ